VSPISRNSMLTEEQKYTNDALHKTQAQLDKAVLDNLRKLLNDPDGSMDLNLPTLWRASEIARERTLAHMIEFGQRIITRNPIPRIFGGRERFSIPSSGVVTPEMLASTYPLHRHYTNRELPPDLRGRSPPRRNFQSDATWKL
jgi:hypothetical protein